MASMADSRQKVLVNGGLSVLPASEEFEGKTSLENFDMNQKARISHTSTTLKRKQFETPKEIGLMQIFLKFGEIVVVDDEIV